MQKRLCRRPEIFNDESIHYRIRSLCFCCHEMYTFIISPPRTESIVPPSPDDLEWKIYKAKGGEKKNKNKNNKHTHKYNRKTSANVCSCAHTGVPEGRQTHTPWNIFLKHVCFITPFTKPERKCNKMVFVCVCVCAFFLFPNQRLNQIYEPVMKHFMLIVFVYEQINGSRAKRMMMWAHTQHDRIPEEFISCLQVIRGNN